MTFRCPKKTCAGAVKLSDTACAQCGQPLDVVSLLSLYNKRARASLKRDIVETDCPKCKRKISIREALCPHCGKPFTFGGALASTIRGPSRGIRKYINRLSPGEMRTMRWGYAVVSALCFWLLLRHVERIWTEEWLTYSGVAAVYVAFLYLIFLWLVPSGLRGRIGSEVLLAAKVGMLFNFFSAILALLIFIHRYWGQASKVAILFGIVFVGFYLFSAFMREVWDSLTFDWDKPRSTFNHLGRQGRNAYHD